MGTQIFLCSDQSRIWHSTEQYTSRQRLHSKSAGCWQYPHFFTLFIFDSSSFLINFLFKFPNWEVLVKLLNKITSNGNHEQRYFMRHQGEETKPTEPRGIENFTELYIKPLRQISFEKSLPFGFPVPLGFYTSCINLPKYEVIIFTVPLFDVWFIFIVFVVKFLLFLGDVIGFSRQFSAKI